MIRVASLGAGYFARFQIGAWGRLAGAQVVAVGDLDADARRIGAGLAPGAAAQTDLAALLLHEPDLLDIATPPASHAEMVRAALGRVPTIVCQKPFCTDLAEACAVATEAENTDTRLIVHENFRFQPWYRELARLVHGDLIGATRQARVTLRPGDGTGDDAYLARQPYFRQMPRFLIRETGIHHIDVLRFLLGEPHALYADLRRENPVIAGEDAGLVIFEFDGGVRAVFDGNRTLDHAADNLRLTMGEMEIEGIDGELRLDGTGRIRSRARGSKDWTAQEYAFEDKDFGGNCVELFQAHVLRALAGEEPFETQATDYLRNLELEAAVYDSAAQGRRLEVAP